jgi:hypothetical protein
MQGDHDICTKVPSANQIYILYTWLQCDFFRGSKKITKKKKKPFFIVRILYIIYNNIIMFVSLRKRRCAMPLTVLSQGNARSRRAGTIADGTRR